jgi:hypothetical protein
MSDGVWVGLGFSKCTGGGVRRFFFAGPSAPRTEPDGGPAHPQGAWLGRRGCHSAGLCTELWRRCGPQESEDATDLANRTRSGR